MNNLRTCIHAVIQASAEGWYVAECEEIAVVTQGRTLDEASQNLAEAVSLHLEEEDLQAMGFVAKPSLTITLELQPEYA
ncbi:MAG: type II toxin-antitoxin system HicB family antitoxin [Cyanobacteria bacterium P01_G01_bin.54]